MSEKSSRSLRALAGLNLNLDALDGLEPEDRKRAEKELLALEREFKRNPLLGYKPHEKQVAFHSPPFPPLRAFFGGNRCHDGLTLVRMADGSAKEIEAVRPGEWIVGCDVDGNARPVRVLDSFCNGFRDCYRYTFGRGGDKVYIDATADHRIVASRRHGVRVKPLGEIGRFWSAHRAGGFEPRTDPGEFEEFGLLLGLLLGDGSFHDGGPKGRLVVFHNTERHMMDLAGVEADRVGLRMTCRGDGAVSLVQRDASPRGWFLDFAQRELGLACHAHQKRIPALVENWSNAAVAKLLAGLFLTDGWVEADGRTVGIQLTSLAMVKQIKRLLEVRFGIYSRGIKVRHYPSLEQRDGFTLKLTSHQALERFLDVIPLTGRKRELLANGLTLTRFAKDSAKMRFLGAELVGRRRVWDLHVDHPDHLFVLANGLITHNSGKTTATIVDSLIQAIDERMVPDHLKAYKRWDPPFYCRVVTPNLSSTLEGVVVEKIKAWCPADQFRGNSFDRALSKQLRLLAFKNGSWFQFCSSDQDPATLGGTALHRVVYDEEPAEATRNECMARLIDFDGEEMFGMTPLHGMSFTFDEIYDPWQAGRFPESEGRVTIVDMDDNPYVSEVGKRRQLAKYKPLEREARKTGRFVSFQGLIYPEFQKQKHVIPDVSAVPKGVELFEGLDPGVRHMAAVLFCYLDVEDCLTVYDEVAVQGKTVADVCREIHLRRAKWQVQPRWTVIDPAARNKSHQTGRSDQQEYMDHGVMTIPGQNSVSAGINRVKERLEADGRLRISARCEELLNEMRRYRWLKNSRSENDSREEPVKKDDHLVDCLRYVCMQRPLVPTAEARAQTLTMKDRLLRADLARIGRRKPVDHPSGAGMFS